jgi:succinoglycan biosynthesis transport protein ExoP
MIMEEVLRGNIDYVAAIRRRLPLSLVVGLLLVVSTLAITFGLPAIYKSRAVILIEQQDIPEDLVRSLVTSYADQRIQVISQRVLTNANLSSIIEKYNLYEAERKDNPLEAVLLSMRKDISVAPISADIVDQKSGKSSKATIAVEISYESKIPSIAQRVANDLVSLFLNENIKQRTEATEETLGFLSGESEKLRNVVGELEARLATFKEKNAGALPELTNLNLQLMTSREQDLAQLQNQIRSLEQQRVYLESELAQQQPTTQLYSEGGQRILGAADRLKVLQSEFIPLKARYGEKHPDVIAMRKEIESLAAQNPESGGSNELAVRLIKLQSELAVLQEKYAPTHPDVKSLVREIESVKAQQAANRANGDSVARFGSSETPDNPAYIQLKARLEATISDLGSLQAQSSSMKAKIAEFETKLTSAPQVEREYRSLTRDYEIALAKYQEVLGKRQEAEFAKNLESGQKGERFTLIEPPVIPEEPDRPNRLVIGILGLVAATGGAVGVGVLSDAMDSRVYGRSGVMQLLGVPPLAVIPNLDNASTRRERTRRYILMAALLLALVAGASLLIHFLYQPIDVVFYRALRLIGF